MIDSHSPPATAEFAVSAAYPIYLFTQIQVGLVLSEEDWALQWLSHLVNRSVVAKRSEARSKKASLTKFHFIE